MLKMRLFEGNEEGQKLEKKQKLTLGNQPIIHRMKHAIAFQEEKEKTTAIERWELPGDLLIITCHNSKEITLFEKNLRMYGFNHVSLHDYRNPWKNTYKIENLYYFLSGDYINFRVRKCPYVLFCDAFDVVICDNPAEIISRFKESNCDLLFGSTMSKRGLARTSRILQWNNIIGKKRDRHLSAGVCVGKWDFILKVYEEALKYIDIDNRYLEYEILKKYGIEAPETTKNWPDNFVRHSDQDILRIIHPLFYPQMEIDYFNYLCYRN